MTTAIDRRCLSPKRQLLCSRENALRVAGRIFDHSQGKVSILRTTDPLQPFRISTDPASSGLIVHGMEDEVVDGEDVQKLVDKLKLQKHITIDYEKIDGANHFYANEMPELMGTVEKYIDRRLASGD